MQNRVFDRYVSIVLIATGTFFIVESLQISQSTYGSSVGPNIFPTVLGAALVLLSFLLFFQTLKSKEHNEEKEERDYKKFLLTLAMAIFYAMTIEWLGYVISTFVFLLAGFQIMQRGKLLYSIVISALFSAVVYYVYVEVLQGTLQGFPSWLAL